MIGSYSCMHQTGGYECFPLVRSECSIRPSQLAHPPCHKLLSMLHVAT